MQWFTIGLRVWVRLRVNSIVFNYNVYISSNTSRPNIFQNARKSQTALILEALKKADLPLLKGFHNHSVPPTRLHLLNSLVKIAERELVLLIEWAKNVPGKEFITAHSHRSAFTGTKMSIVS